MVDSSPAHGQPSSTTQSSKKDLLRLGDDEIVDIYNKQKQKDHKKGISFKQFRLMENLRFASVRHKYESGPSPNDVLNAKLLPPDEGHLMKKIDPLIVRHIMTEYNGGKFSKELLKAFIKNEDFRAKVNQEIDRRKQAMRNSRGVQQCLNRILKANANQHRKVIRDSDEDQGSDYNES